MKLLGAALMALMLGGCVSNQSSDFASAPKEKSKPSASRSSGGGTKQSPRVEVSFVEALDRVVQDIRNLLNPAKVAVAAEGATSAPIEPGHVPKPRPASDARSAKNRSADAPVRVARARHAPVRSVREAGVEGVRPKRTNPARAARAPTLAGVEAVTSSTRVSSPALAYERAMLARDVEGLARAAAQIRGQPVTEESVRALNAQLGIEADDELVADIARAAPR